VRPVQHRAADLLGRGWTNEEVATELGTSSRTISRWKEHPDFLEAVRRVREEQLAEYPTARAALEAALHATTPRGLPDWSVRVQAARALLGHEPRGSDVAEKVRETRIYVGHLDADAG
jgi:hypothetical protein